MRVLVCGSRSLHDSLAARRTIMFRIAMLPPGTEVIAGGARGADSIAANFAKGLGLTVREFPADWIVYGRSAGFRRNVEMLDQEPDLVIAFWDGKSTGTAHTRREAEKRGIPVEVIQA